MALVASDIVNDVRSILLDDDSVEWSDADLLGIVSDAGRLLSNYKPDAYTKLEFFDLIAGTNQSIGSRYGEPVTDAIVVLDVGPNEVSQRAVTLVDKALLDTENRFWAASTPEVDAQHWTADPRDPRRFQVTPPNDGTGSVEILYGAAPPQLDAMADPIVFADTYKYALTAFSLHRAYAEQSRKGDSAKSQQWLQNGLRAIGITSVAQTALIPKATP